MKKCEIIKKVCGLLIIGLMMIGCQKKSEISKVDSTEDSSIENNFSTSDDIENETNQISEKNQESEEVITKSGENNIDEFSIHLVDSESEKYIGNIKNNKITINIPFGTNKKELVVEGVISENATIEPSFGSVVDFSENVTFTVTAENENKKEYLVTLKTETLCVGNENHGIVIDSKEFIKTNEKVVIPKNRSVKITGSNSAWNKFYIGSDSFYKGAFIEGRNVELTSYVIGEYEVTQELYDAIMKSDPDVDSVPSSFSSNTVPGEVQHLRPVEKVSWYDAVYFCNALSEVMGLEKVYTITNIKRDIGKQILSADVVQDSSKNGYCLPTEAEWEFAARGGVVNSANWIKAFSGTSATTINIAEKETDANLNNYSWYVGTSGGRTHEVGLKNPNSLGLYDMSGNVWEWCWDYYQDSVISSDENYLKNEYVVNPKGPLEGSSRMIKGGSWFDLMYYNCVACRYKYQPDNLCSDRGFRLIRHQ